MLTSVLSPPVAQEATDETTRPKPEGRKSLEINLSVIGPGFAHHHLRLPLVGDYQPANAALAVAAAHLLGNVGSPGDLSRHNSP